MQKIAKKSKKNKAITARSLLSRRVVKDKDKADKRELIVDLAGHILLLTEYSDLSMELVAKKAGIAKGTLYLYFQSKEELCLEVLERDYLGWFSDLTDALKNGTIKNSEELSHWVVNSLRIRRRFLKLIPIASSILESNVADEFILKHKLRLSTELEKAAAALHGVFTDLSAQQAAVTLVQIHIAVIGAWSHGFPNPKVQRVIKQKSLRSLDFDYFDLLGKTLDALLSSL